MSNLRARPITDEEWAGYDTHIAHAFLNDHKPDSDAPALRELFPGDRFLGVVDDQRFLGGGGIQTRDMTLVGAGPTPVAAVSYVGVRPDGRGRGALSTLMRAQFDELHTSAAEPVAVLRASMAPIYGRFGYALASQSATLTVTAPGEFRPGSPVGGKVRWLTEREAAPLLRELHGRVVGRRVGWLSREEPNWRWWLGDSGFGGGPAITRRYAVHHGDGGEPDGYAAFDVQQRWPVSGPDYRLTIKELVATTPAAHAELWRGLLDLDMVGSVRHEMVALDDPLPWLLRNPRGVLTDVVDQLWVRLVDLPRALAARRYAGGCELVLEVSDGFCAWNTGRWRLRVDDTGTALVEPTAAEPELACDVTDLGAAYLGGTRLTTLAAAGRVRELRSGAVVAASRAFAGDVEPYCPEVF